MAAIDWVKVILMNWKTLVSIVTLLLSLLGWQTYETVEAKAEVVQTKKQVAQVAESYRAAYMDKAPEKVEVRTITERVCTCDINAHIKEYH